MDLVGHGIYPWSKRVDKRNEHELRSLRRSMRRETWGSKEGEQARAALRRRLSHEECAISPQLPRCLCTGRGG